MEPGPFTANIMPVKATTRFDDKTGYWHLTVSRQIVNGAGVKREITRETFIDYQALLTAISVYWGNA